MLGLHLEEHPLHAVMRRRFRLLAAVVVWQSTATMKTSRFTNPSLLVVRRHMRRCL
jgi:hypothetical protein